MIQERLVLASSSPRRFDLLKALGIDDILVVSPDIDETPSLREPPPQYVIRLAKEKAAVVAKNYPGHYVLGADTVVAVGRRILGKAENAEEATKQFMLLSGRRHRVYTGVCVITPQGKVCSKLATTHITFKHLSEQEIKRYVESEEWKGVAVYRSQGKAGAFIRSITGTPSNIMGLPLYEVSQLLEGIGIRYFK